MPHTARRLSDIVQAMLADRGWRTHPSEPTGTTADPGQLVFIGNWQDPCPRRLLFDPELEPVDVVTWQVIRVHADAHKIVAFPSYAELMRALRVSRPTVARALAVLRLTRWLPLCAALRDHQGRFAGHVYALNDEPLPLAEILAIDGAYVSFAEKAQHHRSAHVRALAQSVLGVIRDDVDTAALEPRRVCDQIAHRLDQLLTLCGDRVQNLNSANRVQNLNSVGSSSSNNKKITTTQAANPAETDPARLESLVFPSELSLTDSQCRVLQLRLEQVPANLQQDVLDEAAGRILGKRGTTDPVRCEFDYIARLCARAREGEFTLTDAGERVRKKRRERSDGEERLRRAREYSEAQRLKMHEAHKARHDVDGSDGCSNLEHK